MCLFTPAKEPMPGQTKDPISVQLGEPMSLTGLLAGAEMTQRQLHH